MADIFHDFPMKAPRDRVFQAVSTPLHRTRTSEHLHTRLTSGFFLSVVIALIEIGCDTTDVDCVCTADFKQITFAAVDADQNPVTDMDITVVVARTGQVLDVGQSQILMDQGIYAVFDDGFRHIVPSKVNTVGERLEVTGAGSAGQFEANFEVSVPGECACHVHKVSGPDTVAVD